MKPDRVKKLQETIIASKDGSPQGLVQKVLAMVAGEIKKLESITAQEELLGPGDAKMLSGYIDDILKISKEYRDGDIDPLGQLKDMSAEEENDLLIELCIERGIIKDGAVIHYVKEK